MKTLQLIFLTVIAFTLPAYAQPRLEPIPLPQKGSCPFGYSSDSRYCTPGSGAKFAILKDRISSSCPSNYSNEGAYCVAQSFARYAIIKTGNSCPNGYSNEGDFCVSSR